MNTSLTAGQVTVLRAFHEFGAMDDTALAVYVHHVAELPMSSSGIRTRRAELVRKSLVHAVATKRLKSGRHAAIHALTPEGAQISNALALTTETLV